MTPRRLALIDLLVPLGALLLLPLAVASVHSVTKGCVPSAKEAQRAITLWWILTLLAAVATYLVARLAWRAVVTRVVGISLLILLAAITLPNLDFGSLDRSREKRALADMRVIAAVLENYRATTGSYPTVQSVGELRRYSTSHLSALDPWRAEYVVRSSPNSYSIMSRGICGAKPLALTR